MHQYQVIAGNRSDHSFRVYASSWFVEFACIERRSERWLTVTTGVVSWF